jgi:hypothetical protein
LLFVVQVDDIAQTRLFFSHKHRNCCWQTHAAGVDITFHAFDDSHFTPLSLTLPFVSSLARTAPSLVSRYLIASSNKNAFVQAINALLVVLPLSTLREKYSRQREGCCYSLGDADNNRIPVTLRIVSTERNSLYEEADQSLEDLLKFHEKLNAVLSNCKYSSSYNHGDAEVSVSQCNNISFRKLLYY